MGNFGRLVQPCQAGIPDQLMFILSGNDTNYNTESTKVFYSIPTDSEKGFVQTAVLHSIRGNLVTTHSYAHCYTPLVVGAE